MTLAALTLVMASALLHAIWSVTIKGSRDPLVFNALQTFPQALVGLALIPLAVDFAPLPDALWGWLVLAAVAHGLYLYWMGRAYELADISLVYPIARSTPAFLPLLAVPLLGETISGLGGLGIATVVAGIWLVNTGGDFRWRALLGPGTLFAVLTLTTTVGYGLSDKGAMNALEAMDWSSWLPRAVFYYFAVEVACSGVFAAVALRHFDRASFAATARSEWVRALGAGSISFASYGLILEALRSASASYVVAVRQSSVLFVVVLSVLWLGERPSRPRVVGSLATVAGVALVVLGG